MNEGVYYLKLAGKVEGPYTIGQIYDLWAARKINSQTQFARLEEMDKWQPLSELTLTIAPPRPNAPRAPTPEPAAAAPARQRQVPHFRPEDYVPSLQQRAEARTSRPKRRTNKIELLAKKFILRMEFAIAACFVLGAGLAAYFMVFFAAGPSAGQAEPENLGLKLSGVIVGVGTVLLGGLLVIARQIKQALEPGQPELLGKAERRAGQPQAGLR